MCDNHHTLVIVTHYWPRLCFNEREPRLIVRNIWRLFSQISGQTMLIVRNIWPNQIVQIPTVLIGKDRFCGRWIFLSHQGVWQELFPGTAIWNCIAFIIVFRLSYSARFEYRFAG
jgi:hypothetical protein